MLVFTAYMYLSLQSDDVWGRLLRIREDRTFAMRYTLQFKQLKLLMQYIRFKALYIAR